MEQIQSKGERKGLCCSKVETRLLKWIFAVSLLSVLSVTLCIKLFLLNTELDSRIARLERRDLSDSKNLLDEYINKYLEDNYDQIFSLKFQKLTSNRKTRSTDVGNCQCLGQPGKRSWYAFAG
ncbi:uncharacterized protein LOC117109976 [Anneissia japonica]|uniref:uncharacterized protein LOC117109976 n=1 Tax=Anneissia japonica TaxID=1529436 RepID=UPI001425B17D|nr:uncharacterized protein LOC117109976 [Anneissia japonica]